MLGFITVFDNPARQTFVREMVGTDRLTNAVSLNSTEFNLARVIGPAIAGILAATIGLGACFIADGLSYIAVLYCALRMRADEFSRRSGSRAEGPAAGRVCAMSAPPVLQDVDHDGDRRHVHVRVLGDAAALCRIHVRFRDRAHTPR